MSNTEVYHLTEGEWFVRGTEDVKIATDLLLDDPEVAEYDDGIAEDCDLEPHVTVIRAGLFRFVPCGPGSCGEHGWHLRNATKRGRGVFPGVFFESVRFEPVEFECDYAV